MVARDDPHHFAAFGVNADIAAQGIHHVNGFGLGQFPWPRGKGIGFAGQRANRAQINDVALQVAVQRGVQIAGDLRVFAPARLAHLGDARDFGGKAHTAGAGNTAGHLGGHQWPQVQILGRAFGLAVAAEIDAERHCLILQITLAALIANRAIQGVVDQQELHHAFAGAFDHRRFGFHHRCLAFGTGAQIFDLHRARCRGFWRAADDLYQTHPAIARDGQPFVVAKTRNFHPRHFGRLNDSHITIDFDLDAVKADFLEVGHGGLSIRQA